MLQLKDLRGLSVGEKVAGSDGKTLKELEGPRGGGAWFVGHALFRQAEAFDPDKIEIYDFQGNGGPAVQLFLFN